MNNPLRTRAAPPSDGPPLTVPAPPAEGQVPHPVSPYALAADRALDLVAEPGDDTFLARLRLRQQMPRLSRRELADPRIAAAEARAVLERIRRDQQGFLHWHEGRGDGAAGSSVRDVPADVTRAVCERFHYVGTPRDGAALGLYFAGTPQGMPPATLLLASRFDLAGHGDALPAGVAPDNVLLLSRVYTFRWAPRNAFSFCWSRALPLLRQRFPQAALVLTYLDPNVGFTASSYLAANWLWFAADAAADYLYLDRQYVTGRELARRFGTGTPAALRQRLGGRLTTARQPIVPQELWAFPLRRSLRRALLRRRDRPAGAAGAADAAGTAATAAVNVGADAR